MVLHTRHGTPSALCRGLFCSGFRGRLRPGPGLGSFGADGATKRQMHPGCHGVCSIHRLLGRTVVIHATRNRLAVFGRCIGKPLTARRLPLGDIVLIDLPPVLAVSDPLIAAPKLGGVVLVVRAATARKSEVANSMNRLQTAGSNIVGCVLNTFGAGRAFSSDGGYYGYYQSSYTSSSSTPKHHGVGTNGSATVNGSVSPITKAKAAVPMPTESESASRR